MVLLNVKHTLKLNTDRSFLSNYQLNAFTSCITHADALHGDILQHKNLDAVTHKFHSYSHRSTLEDMSRKEAFTVDS
jgi:hypothetical protein